jgi:methionine synthase I (cobalamin-dependent)
MINLDLKQLLFNSLFSRILVLDGATGTMIQRYKLEEKDYRGERFANYQLPLKGNNDLLTLTQPQIIAEIHEKYLEAGADIIETNTFNAQAISLADYEMENLAYEINFEAARIAKQAALKFSTPENPRFVAGSIGPSNKSLTLPPNPDKTDERSCDFATMANAYQIQVEGLMDGGADILLVETIFDTLNAKACLFAIQKVFDTRKCELPVMISVTISDKSDFAFSVFLAWLKLCSWRRKYKAISYRIVISQQCFCKCLSKCRIARRIWELFGNTSRDGCNCENFCRRRACEYYWWLLRNYARAC